MIRIEPLFEKNLRKEVSKLESDVHNYGMCSKCGFETDDYLSKFCTHTVCPLRMIRKVTKIKLAQRAV